MLAELVDRLVALGHHDNTPLIVKEHGIPHRTLIYCNGQPSWIEAPPPRRAHNYHGLTDLIIALCDSDICPAPEVYHFGAQVIAFTNRATRRETISMNLQASERFRALEALRAGMSLDPRAAIKKLRDALGASAPGPVITSLRKIDFTRTSAGRSSVEHGKESLGRSVEAAVQQADQIPDEFTVRCPVYTNPGLGAFWAELQVALYLNMDEQTVELRVMPDEIDKAVQTAQARLHDELVKNLDPGVPVFFGTP